MESLTWSSAFKRLVCAGSGIWIDLFVDKDFEPTYGDWPDWYHMVEYIGPNESTTVTFSASTSAARHDYAVLIDSMQAVMGNRRGSQPRAKRSADGGAEGGGEPVTPGGTPNLAGITYVGGFSSDGTTEYWIDVANGGDRAVRRALLHRCLARSRCIRRARNSTPTATTTFSTMTRAACRARSAPPRSRSPPHASCGAWATWWTTTACVSESSETRQHLLLQPRGQRVPASPSPEGPGGRGRPEQARPLSGHAVRPRPRHRQGLPCSAFAVVRLVELVASLSTLEAGGGRSASASSAPPCAQKFRPPAVSHFVAAHGLLPSSSLSSGGTEPLAVPSSSPRADKSSSRSVLLRGWKLCLRPGRLVHVPGKGRTDGAEA